MKLRLYIASMDALDQNGDLAAASRLSGLLRNGRFQNCTANCTRPCGTVSGEVVEDDLELVVSHSRRDEEHSRLCALSLNAVIPESSIIRQRNRAV